MKPEKKIMPLIFFLVVAVLPFLFSKCNNETKNKTVTLFGKPKAFAAREMTIEQAKVFVKGYKDDVTSGKPVLLEELSRKSITSFRIDTMVLNKLATLNGYSGIRVYFALRGYTAPPERAPIYTLVIVPTGPEYQNGRNKNILRDNYIYDWTEPCPTNCPDDGTELK